MGRTILKSAEDSQSGITDYGLTSYIQIGDEGNLMNL